MKSEGSRRYTLWKLDNVFYAATDKLKPSASTLQFMPASLALPQQLAEGGFWLLFYLLDLETLAKPVPTRICDKPKSLVARSLYQNAIALLQSSTD